MKQLTYNGTFSLILGNMWSGKTTELLRRYRRYTIGGKKCLLVKYKGDTRYDNSKVVTHDGVMIDAVVCEYLYEVDKCIGGYDVVCIDEVQFYKDADIFIDYWANQGKIIEACGLNGTFNRTEFPVISKLLPLTENLTFLKAVCKETGNDAVYSNINVVVEGNNTEIIGGSEKYNAVDRETYFKDKCVSLTDFIKKFACRYAEMTNNNFNISNSNNSYTFNDFAPIDIVNNLFNPSNNK